MLPRETIDSFETSDGHLFTLVRHDRDFYIELNHEELMSTRRTGSEVALAELGCEGLNKVTKPRVLVGGLGFGFTLRAALEQLPADAELVVADLFPQVVEWNRTHLAGLYGDSLRDPRLKIVIADVWKVLGEGPWHAILMDTDNGPEAFCLKGNSRLYRDPGLERMRDALVPGGLLAIWASDVQPRFVQRMKKIGFDASVKTAKGHRNRGHSFAIYLGRLPSGRSRSSVPQGRSTSGPGSGHGRKRPSRQGSPSSGPGRARSWSKKRSPGTS